MCSRVRQLVLAVLCAGTVVVASEAVRGGGKDKAGPWKSLFDGKTLKGWKVAKFGGEGEVEVEKGAIVMGAGEPMTGITLTAKDFPRMNYELEVKAKKLEGNDFFCTTTFPVGKDYCSLVMGGWGGTVVGLSSLDGMDASENDTQRLVNFDPNRWYVVRIRVTPDRIAAWIDGKEVVNAGTKDRKVSIRVECDLCKPVGIATWRTKGAVGEVKVRSLK